MLANSRRETSVHSYLRNLFASLKPVFHIASRQYARNVSRRAARLYHFTVAMKRGISSRFVTSGEHAGDVTRFDEE